MPVAKVHRISASSPNDASGLEAAIASGRIDPKGVIAVLGKTEGNGLVNDFSRGLATTALTVLFERHLPRAEAAQICLVMSGGTEGGMAPHWTVFERGKGEGGRSPALAIGRAHTLQLPYEQLGRLGEVDQVAAGVRAAMEDAGIADPVAETPVEYFHGGIRVPLRQHAETLLFHNFTHVARTLALRPRQHACHRGRGLPPSQTHPAISGRTPCGY